MFLAKVDVDLSVIRTQREIARRAPGAMGNYVQMVMVPQVQRKVSESYAPYPPPAIHPFVFATARSRRWYFANVRAGNIPTDGRGYVRSGALGQAWRVLVDRRQNEGFLTVKNVASSAIYVFGNRQVPGHRNTGWGAQFERANHEVGDLATYLLAKGWFLISTGRYDQLS